MFLHIGGSKIIDGRDIVGIFDIRTKDRPSTKEFLENLKTPELDGAGEEIKSFIVTPGSVSFSPIAPGTLKKRFLAYNLE